MKKRSESLSSSIRPNSYLLAQYVLIFSKLKIIDNRIMFFRAKRISDLENEVTVLQDRVQYLEQLTKKQQSQIDNLTFQLSSSDTFKSFSPSISQTVNNLFSPSPTVVSHLSSSIATSSLFQALWTQLENTYSVKAKSKPSKYAKWNYLHETLKELLIGFLTRIRGIF
jgi:hypothetical protein